MSAGEIMDGFSINPLETNEGRGAWFGSVD